MNRQYTQANKKKNEIASKMIQGLTMANLRPTTLYHDVRVHTGDGESFGEVGRSYAMHGMGEHPNQAGRGMEMSRGEKYHGANPRAKFTTKFYSQTGKKRA